MSSNEKVVNTEVLIVGAGPAGATAAILLARSKIANITINKYNTVSKTPRAHITNQRAMETFRDMGLEQAAIAQATPQDLMGEHVWATSLTGPELGRLRTWYTHPHFKAEHDLASPCAVCDLPQHLLEPILVTAASNLGSHVRFNTELIALAQDADGVTARVQDSVSGEQYSIRSKYLIGADGGRSTVAALIDLPFEGEMGMGGSINVGFEADLAYLTAHRPGDMYWFIQPGVGHNGNGIGVLRMIRPWHEWMGVWGYDVNGPAPDLTEALGKQVVHQLLGDGSIPVKITHLSTWAVNHMYATDNTRSRVFCAGDAVHRHSPMNGLGSNTSIQDSYNLCWKIALVLRGKASPSLLETYREERVPVARHLIDRTVRSNNLMPPLFQALGLPPATGEKELRRSLERLSSPTAEDGAMRAHLRRAIDDSLLCYNTLGMETNQFYSSRAIVTDGATPPVAPRNEEEYYFPSTFPGRHLPHIWVTKKQRRVPIFDLCGQGVFSLLIGIRGHAWRKAAVEAAARLDIPIKVHSIGMGCDYVDIYGDWARSSEVAEDGALLVRPDHIIGWRAQNSSGEPSQRLLAALAQILGRLP